MADPTRNIEKEKKSAIDELGLSVDAMAEAAYELMVKLMDSHFDTAGGYVLADKGFVKELNRVTTDFLELLKSSPKFSGPVTQFVKRMDDISAAMEKFNKAMNGIDMPAYETAKKVAIEEILDQMLNNGLNQGFVQPLRDLIYQNVTSGLSLTEAKQAIRQYIAGGKDVTGKLGSYIDQTARQAVNAYTGLINMKLLQTYGYDTLLMTGTLIDNSSPQCIYGLKTLGGKITRENFPAVASKATKKFKLIPGTTFDNLPLNLLHWGCLHQFYPIKA